MSATRGALLLSLLLMPPTGPPPADAETPSSHATAREVREASAEEIRERCPAGGGNDPDTPGRVVVLELAGGVYRMVVRGAVAFVCEVETPPARPPADPDLHALTLQSLADLVVRLAPEPPPIEIRRAERVLWRDSSAGCPRTGQLYSPALTEGSRVVLEANGRTFFYHQVAGGAPFLCERPSPIEPLPPAELQ